MHNTSKQNTLKAGLPPGSLLYTGSNEGKDTLVRIFEYNADDLKEYKLKEEQLTDFEDCITNDQHMVRWVDIDGLKNADTIEKLCIPFHIHPLVMEDILNTAQRAKVEDYDDYLYIVAKMVYFEEGNLVTEQVSIILGKGYVISVGEKKGDVFERIRERIRNNGAHIRKYGADYLAYSVLDAIVDGYFYVLENLGDRIDDVEEQLLRNPSTENLHRMQDIKKDLLYMNKSIWPLREVVSWMERDDTPLIESTTQLYIRDVYDHVIQSIDTTETYRELLSGLMDIYLSSISNKMNEIMKVLTIISTLFIPLTFIAGVYGMNFKHMPELSWKFGYLGVAIVMLIIAGGMALYFRRKKWI